MRHVRMLGLCVMAVFAVSAVAASGASANSSLPEFGGCEAQPSHEGKYADAGCTQPVKKVFGKYTGGYEWYVGEEFGQGYGLAEYNFEGSIGATTFETTTGKAIHCSSGELHQMLIEGPRSVGKLLVTFTGCESEGEECASKYEPYGEISDLAEWLNQEGLKGELVYLTGKKTGTPTVGLTLTAFNAGTPLFTVTCAGSIGTVEIGGAGGKKTEKSKGDAVISLINPVDEMTRFYTQTFTQTAGVQEQAKAEKGKEKTLQMFLSNEIKWVQMGLGMTWSETAESRRHPVEIKAVP